jgi:SAM-dependent methyltransferase
MDNMSYLRVLGKRGFRMLRSISPLLFFLIAYRRSIARTGDKKIEREQAFSELLELSKGKRCLQVGVKEREGKKFGDNWVSIDLYDTREFIDFNCDVMDMPFPDGEFDVCVCMSVLEHVPDPARAISELSRVLKPGGMIWVQVPQAFFYHAQTDYWRVTPDGLRIWMRAFDEKICGFFRPHRVSFIGSTFFCGMKPPTGEFPG